MGEPVVLFINPSDSKCGACGKGASWSEETHDTELGYYAGPRRAGCGARWTHVSSQYMGIDYGHIERMRPDLEWVEP